SVLLRLATREVYTGLRDDVTRPVARDGQTAATKALAPDVDVAAAIAQEAAPASGVAHTLDVLAVRRARRIEAVGVASLHDHTDAPRLTGASDPHPRALELLHENVLHEMVRVASVEGAAAGVVEIDPVVSVGLIR